MGIITRIIVGAGWLALCLWLSDKNFARKVVSVLTGVITMAVVCGVLADRFLDPWLQATHRLPRESIRAQLQAMGLGAVLGLAASPLLVKWDAVFWVFQAVLVLALVIVPSI